MPNSSKTLLPLRFVVVGGSIAGLACAYVLQKSGHQVVVLERSDGKLRSHGGIRSPPNMTRILRQWGMEDRLKAIATKSTGFEFIIAETGKKVGMWKFHEEIMSALRGDFLFVRHGDIHSMILDLALSAGADIRFNCNVISIDPHHAAAALDTGERIQGDILCGADGVVSMVREVVAGREVREKPDKFYSVNMSIPTDLMKEDLDLKHLTTNTDGVMWMGNGFGIYGYLTHYRKDYTLVMIWPVSSGVASSRWCDQYSIDDSRWKLDILRTIGDVRLRKLVQLASNMMVVKDTVTEAFETWVHDSGKVFLIGDAAHPLLPNGSHHVAMAIEDAIALGNLFSRIRSRDQIPRALSAFEEIRQPRCATIQASEYGKREFVTLSRGTAQEKRDRGLKEAMASALLDWDDAPEEYLRAQWEEYIDSFGYDAHEAVDDYWTKWGPVIDPPRGGKAANVAENGAHISISLRAET